MKPTLLLLAVIVAILASAESSYACSCSRASSCEYAARAEAVFVGTVIESTEVSRGTTKTNGFDYERVGQVSRVAIEESFFGTAEKAEILIETDAGSNSCAFRLQKGAKYLIYAYPVDGQPNLGAHYCSGTKDIASASDDIASLRVSQGTAAKIEGRVLFQDSNSADPLALSRFGIKKVRLTGNGKNRDAEIRRDGSYSFADVSPGVYKISISLPASVIAEDRYHGRRAGEGKTGDQGEIRVRASGCLYEDFPLRENGRINGRLIDAQGKPVEKVTVQLIPLDENGQRIPQYGLCYSNRSCVESRSDGSFSFDGLEAGKYLVGVRLDKYLCNDCRSAEFARAFYPGVPDESKGKVVTVVPGEATSTLSFRLSEKLASQKITGRVFLADGRPAGKVRIRYTARTPDRKTNWITFIETDEQGYFSFTGYHDHAYLVGAFTDMRDGNEQAFAAAIVIDVRAGSKLEEIKLTLDSKGEVGDFSGFPKLEDLSDPDEHL